MISAPARRDYLAISIFNLAVVFFWGAMLSVVLQARVRTLVENDFSASQEKQTAVMVTASSVQAQEIEKESATKLGWMLSIGALVATISQMLFGALSDRSRHRAGRRKPFLVAGVLAANIGLLLFPFAHTYAQLFAVFLLLQLCLNIATGPYQALVPDLIPAEHHGKASAYIGVMGLIGRTGGLVLGGVAMTLPGQTGLFVLAAAFFLMLNGLMLVTTRLTHEEPLPKNMSTQETLLQSLRGTFQVELRGQSSFVWVLVSRFMINTGVYTILPVLLAYLINCYSLTDNQATTQLTTIGLIVTLTGLIATFPAGIASDRYSKKRVIYFTSAVCVIGGLGFALSHSIALALLAAGFFGFGYGAFMAVDMALVCNLLPEKEAAKYMGLWGFADTVPQIVAPAIGGTIVHYAISNYGDAAFAYRAVMFTAIGWFILGTICISFVREKNVNAKI